MIQLRNHGEGAAGVVSGLFYFSRRDIYINRLSFKAGLRGIEFNISTEEKNGSPSQSNRSNPK